MATRGAHSAKTDGNVTRTTRTTGWSDCGHDAYRPGLVLDPFAGTGTTQAAAAPVTSKRASLNAQTSQTAFYLPPATTAPAGSSGLQMFAPYYLNYSTLSNASPILFVGVGGYMNGTLNGSITLASGQAAVVWQQTAGLYYSIKTA